MRHKALSTYTVEDLLEEVEARKQDKPSPLDVYNVITLRQLCVDYIERFDSYKHDDDIEHYIFEEALKMIYGKDIFNWVNQKLK